MSHWKSTCPASMRSRVWSMAPHKLGCGGIHLVEAGGSTFSFILSYIKMFDASLGYWWSCFTHAIIYNIWADTGSSQSDQGVNSFTFVQSNYVMLLALKKLAWDLGHLVGGWNEREHCLLTGGSVSCSFSKHLWDYRHSWVLRTCLWWQINPRVPSWFSGIHL